MGSSGPFADYQFANKMNETKALPPSSVSDYLRRIVFDSDVDFNRRLCKCYEDLKEAESAISSFEARQKKGSSLAKLFLNGFDGEQVWQQIELKNGRLRSLKKQLRKNRKRNLNDVGETREAVGDAADDSGDESQEWSAGHRTLGNRSKSDIFFSQKEMDRFLEEEEEKERRKERAPLELSESDTELTDSDSDSSPAREIYYGDFFDPPAVDSELGERGADGVASDQDESDGGDLNRENSPPGALTSLEVREQKLKAEIEDLEEENLAPKSWQMSGDVTVEKRPENALLEEHVAFDHATKLPPVITEETTEKLENIIMQRIRDKAWDDVERKQKPEIEPQRLRNELVLDQQKSNISLSQLYEQEYLKKTQKEKEEQENPKHKEIKDALKDLFSKLDALSNYHYAPKMLPPEVKIVSNMRSLEREEVGPTAATASTALAPEEVNLPVSGLHKAQQELSKTDKLRKRRKKKGLQKKKAAAKAQKETTEQKLGKIASVKKLKKSSKKLSKSGDFFVAMQDTVAKQKPKSD